MAQGLPLSISDHKKEREHLNDLAKEKIIITATTDNIKNTDDPEALDPEALDPQGSVSFKLSNTLDQSIQTFEKLPKIEN